MAKIRAYGADATLFACRETAYGVAPTSGYRALAFKSTDLSAEQPLGEAANDEPVALEYGFSTADGWQLSLELFRVFLPKPKYAIGGPGGVEASFDWRAAYDEANGTMLRARLLNDIASYV